MEKLLFKTTINASREKVWDVLFGTATYPLWTAIFSEGSAVTTDWKKGSRALFHDGNNKGMIAEISENIYPSYLGITHLGMYDNGVEDFDSEEVKPWAGATENYSLTAVEGGTELGIDIMITPAYKDYFMQTWPKALDKVKELAEQNVVPPVVV